MGVVAREGQFGKGCQQVTGEAVAPHPQRRVGRVAVVTQQRLLHRVQRVSRVRVRERDAVQFGRFRCWHQRQTPRAEGLEPLRQRPDWRIDRTAIRAVDDRHRPANGVGADAQSRLRKPGFDQCEDERHFAFDQSGRGFGGKGELARHPPRRFGALPLGRVGQTVGRRRVLRSAGKRVVPVPRQQIVHGRRRRGRRESDLE